MKKATFVRDQSNVALGKGYRLKSLVELTSINVGPKQRKLEVNDLLTLEEIEHFRQGNKNVTVVVNNK
jgi:hypothetical protein